jgi:hypothetical protein
MTFQGSEAIEEFHNNRFFAALRMTIRAFRRVLQMLSQEWAKEASREYLKKLLRRILI